MITRYLIWSYVVGYGYLSRVLGKLKSTSASPIVSVEELGLIVASVISAYIIIFASNAAHSVTTKVTTYLRLVSLSEYGFLMWNVLYVILNGSSVMDV